MTFIGLLFVFFLIFVFFFIIKKNSKLKLHPLWFFSSLWLLVIWGVIVNLPTPAPVIDLASFFLIVSFGAVAVFIGSFQKVPFIRFSSYYFEEAMKLNQVILLKTLVVCLLLRLLQLFHDIYVMEQLGGSLTIVLGDAQWLRFAYLNYSANQMSFISKLISNILNYFAEFGVILSIILSHFKNNNKYAIIALFLALFHSIFTMSKLAFFIDICYVISCYSILYNFDEKEKNNKSLRDIQNVKRKRKYLFMTLTIGIIILLLFTGLQRGYTDQISTFEGLEIIFRKAIAYFITPALAFLKVLEMNPPLSWGTKTFNVLTKLFGFQFETFGAIDVGAEDSTVYTMSGNFYADFGIIGSVILTVLFILICNYIFVKTISHFTIARMALFAMTNTIMLMSFFTWMGRITFFWLFPIFVFAYDKIFLKQPHKNNC